MRTEPIVVRQFDEPVVSAARSVGLGGTLIYCDYQELVLGETGSLDGEIFSTQILAPATIFMHGQFNVAIGALTPGDGHVDINSHLNPGPHPNGWAFSSPVTNDRFTFYPSETFAVGSFSWTGVTSMESGTLEVKPVVSFGAFGVTVDPSQVYGSCFISLIISASTGSDCLTYQPPA